MMANEFKNFKISRGLSTKMFDADGKINPKLLIEEGCWYLCVDTAELYVAIKTGNVTTLKRINTGNLEEEISALRDEVYQVGSDILTELRAELRALSSVELFKKISDEGDLPTDFEAADFNPNVTYYIPVIDAEGEATGSISTYIYDKDSRSYFRTQSVDEDAIIAAVYDTVRNIVDELMLVSLPETLKETLKTVILHGGDASC